MTKEAKTLQDLAKLIDNNDSVEKVTVSIVIKKPKTSKASDDK